MVRITLTNQKKLMQQLPSNLKFLMRKLGQSQASIESVVERRQQTISNWLAGKGEPDASDLIKLSHFFGISIDDLCLTDLANGNLIDEAYLARFRQIGKVKGNLLGNPMASIHHFSGEPKAMQEGQEETYLWAVLQQLKAMDQKLEAFGKKLELIRLSREKGHEEG
jgi:transcriptional regulator with XRE-family HTH domain